MIERYSREEMSNIWTDQNRYEAWLEVEILACEAWSKLGDIPEEDVKKIRQNAKVNVERAQVQLFGSSSSAGAGAANRTVECYTFADLVEEMERACVALEREIATTENDAEKTLEEMRKIVGELSDLRYGKLNKPGVTPDDYVTETVRGLKRLEEACDEAAARST